MNFLETIIAYKREEIADKKRSAPCSYLENLPRFKRKALSFAGAMRDRDVTFIAEIRRPSSPGSSIGRGFDPLAVVQECVRLGASALSIPTDEKFLLGRPQYIGQIRDVISVPVVSRDFVIDPYQVYEAKAHGADALFLMASVLDPGQMAELASQAAALGLESVAEVHSEDELEALDWSLFQSVCINNRDVFTFDTDVYTCTRLKKQVPPDKFIIAEGGISTTHDIDLLLSHGIHSMLIGEPFGTEKSAALPLTDVVHHVAAIGRDAHIVHR